MRNTTPTYPLYEARRTEHALCADFPADKELIRGLHTLEKYWWNKGWQSSLSVVCVMNAVHYVVTYMLNVPTRTQAEYDQLIYDSVGQDRMLMQAAMLALPQMLKRIPLPEARTYYSLMMEDRPEDFYEGVSMYEQWLEGAEQHYRVEDFLIDVMDEMNIIKLQNKNLLKENEKMKEELRERPAPVITNYGTYIAEQHNDIHDNENCSIYTCPPQDRIDETHASKMETTELYKFIYHTITDEDERMHIHKAMCNIVRLPKMQLVCEALKEMMKSGKIYSSVNPDNLLKELRRIGLPDGNVPGFSDSNFFSYYKA